MAPFNKSGDGNFTDPNNSACESQVGLRFEARNEQDDIDKKKLPCTCTLEILGSWLLCVTVQDVHAPKSAKKVNFSIDNMEKRLIFVAHAYDINS